MTEHRQDVRADQSLPAEVRERIQLFLKITANAGGYGIYAEHNRQDLPRGKKARVEVYAGGGPFTATITAPEDPGIYTCPPLAAVITGAARLMLAMLERCVIDLGGAWAFADTDSMAIVATPAGALVRCEGGPYRDQHGRECVRALTHGDVEQIRDRFAALNPYGAAIDGTIVKRELDAFCYAIAAKRYALYRYDDTGRPRLVPAEEHEPCSHGLGHLLNPTDPDSDDPAWIVQFWEHALAAQLTSCKDPAPTWFVRPAIGKIAITSPATHRALLRYNRGKSYAGRIKPFGFLLHAPGADSFGNNDLGRIVAPYTRDAARWMTLRWTDLDAPDRDIKISTDASHPVRVVVDTYATILDTYLTHPEAKSLDADGKPCGRATRGLLGRRHVEIDTLIAIGKEANELEERAAGITADPKGEARLHVYGEMAPNR